jgi:hypothetical protein
MGSGTEDFFLILSQLFSSSSENLLTDYLSHAASCACLIFCAVFQAMLSFVSRKGGKQLRKEENNCHL